MSDWIRSHIGPGGRLSNEGRFPSLDGATRWLNSPPLTPAGLSGKVVDANFCDANGRIRHRRFGEGDYEASERVIQELLRENGVDVDDALAPVRAEGPEAEADWIDLESPETYLGDDRTVGFASLGLTILADKHRVGGGKSVDGAGQVRAGA